MFVCLLCLLFEIKKTKKMEENCKIQKHYVFVYTGTGTCSLDEPFHAQLSNVSFMAHYVICMNWLIFYHS